MVRRRGIGASLAAVFIFSTLLISNFALLASADQRQKLSLTAYTESRYGGEAVVLSGTESLAVLVSLQGWLASRPMECSNAAEQTARYLLSLNASAAQGGLSVIVSVTADDSARAGDNLSIVRPFNGSYANGVNLATKIEWNAVSPLGDVTLHKVEHHLLNLPALLNPMVDLCESAVGRYRSFFQNDIFPACNDSSVGPAVATVGQSILDAATKQGFVFQASYRLVASSGCLIDLALRVAQLEISGPAGDFNLILEQESSLPVLTDE